MTRRQYRSRAMGGKYQDLSTANLINQAIALHRAGNLKGAEQLYLEVLRYDKRHFDALHLLGVIRRQQGRNTEALDLIVAALKRNPNAVEALSSCGLVLDALGRHEDAIKRYNKALAIRGNYAEALNNRGAALKELKRHEEALVNYDKALTIKPDYAEALNNRGNTLKELKRHEEALASYDRALAIRPTYANAMIGRGIVLQELKRSEDALASYDMALIAQPNSALALYSRGTALQKLKQLDAAVASYDKAIALKPDYAEAYSNRGLALQELNQLDAAAASYDKSIALKPDLAGAWLGRGNVFDKLRRYEEALGAYDKALALKPDLAEAWLGRGNVFSELKRYDEALAAYDNALTLKPDLTAIEGLRLHTKMHLCDWSNFDAECSRLIDSVRDGKINALPFSLLATPSSAKEQLQCAKLWIANKYPPSDEPIWQGERFDHNRIRVGYLSADFHGHATCYLMAGMIECHDKFRFETIAISWGPDDNSEMRKRLEASFERFINVEKWGDEQIANLVRDLEIDILIDLKGFTTDSRTGILSRRPAPIQVSYLGYPGTMGAEYIDYIIADQTVIPENSKQCYCEKIIYLPNSYQVNDSKRSISDRAVTRAELGLPPGSFVFCCFNNNYKITPRIFDCWMRILKQVQDSVLWLLEDDATAAANLRNEAVARDVNAERLIFAKRIPLPEHLARHRCADLFLDTLPYNAHTTASDALWAGLPVLTCLGETFAGRVAASLLNALRLPELIATTPQGYEQTAIDLATYPEELMVIKRRLAERRLTAPLFDTKAFTKHIEAAYTAMYERGQAGLPPDHIVI